MSENPLDASRIRRYVDQNIKKARRTQTLILLGVNFGMYVLFNLMAWIIALTSNPTNDQMIGSLIMLSIGWTVSLFMHGVAAWTDSDTGQRQLRQQLALKAVQQAIGQSALEAAEASEVPEKRKHEQVVELSDDGELIPAEEVEAEPKQKEEAQS
jgi:hypothetical protein